MKASMIKAIQDRGPLPFDRFMEWSLYDSDEGFFSAGRVRAGESADFVTSPEVSPAFGELIGAWAWAHRPSEGCALVEIGGGTGALLSGIAPRWLDAGADVFAVEVSGAARNAISQLDSRIHVVERLSQIPSGIDAVVIANEVLDNLPAALARRTPEGWREVHVGAADGDLELVHVRPRPEVTEWVEAFHALAPAGTTAVVQLAVREWFADVADRFSGLALCVIDYATSSAVLEHRDLNTLLRSYRQQQTGMSWLDNPGTTDITVDVNIDGVIVVAAELGIDLSVTTQADFLKSWGLDDMIAETRDAELRHASTGSVMDQLVERSRRVGMEALANPGGLGGFSVFTAKVEPDATR